MPHLLDTQIFIWALISPEKLSLQTKSLMQNHEIFISQITLQRYQYQLITLFKP